MRKAFNILRQNRASLVLTIFFAVAPIVSSSLLTVGAVSYADYIQTFGFWEWSLFFLIAGITMSLALTPATMLALITGYFMGLEAMFFMVMSYGLASWLGYNLASYVDGGQLIESLKQMPKVRRLMLQLRFTPMPAIIFSRLSPILPFAITNVLFSLLRVDIKKFLIGGTVGMLPRTFLMVWTGSQVNNFQRLIENPGEGIVMEIALVLLIGVSVGGFYWFFKSIAQRSVTRRNKRIADRVTLQAIAAAATVGIV